MVVLENKSCSTKCHLWPKHKNLNHFLDLLGMLWYYEPHLWFLSSTCLIGYSSNHYEESTITSSVIGYKSSHLESFLPSHFQCCAFVQKKCYNLCHSFLIVSLTLLLNISVHCLKYFKIIMVQCSCWMMIDTPRPYF